MSVFDLLKDPLGIGAMIDQAHAPPESVATGPAARTNPERTDTSEHGLTDFTRGIVQEGLGGMIDPIGMMDRQKAQRELAQRFHVRGDGEPAAPGAPGNSVTEHQFEEIARQYSDIRVRRHVN